MLKKKWWTNPAFYICLPVEHVAKLPWPKENGGPFFHVNLFKCAWALWEGLFTLMFCVVISGWGCHLYSQFNLNIRGAIYNYDLHIPYIQEIHFHWLNRHHVSWQWWHWLLTSTWKTLERKSRCPTEKQSILKCLMCASLYFNILLYDPKKPHANFCTINLVVILKQLRIMHAIHFFANIQEPTQQLRP